MEVGKYDFKLGILINALFLLLAVGVMYLASVTGQQPYNDILGSWKEVSWEYEKVDIVQNDVGSTLDDIIKKTREEVAANLIIHQAEEWEFLTDSKMLITFDDGSSEILDWKLKSKGDILKLKHKDTIEEYYTIRELDDTHMVLHFYVETNARGIMKLTFERT